MKHFKTFVAILALLILIYGCDNMQEVHDKVSTESALQELKSCEINKQSILNALYLTQVELLEEIAISDSLEALLGKAYSELIAEKQKNGLYQINK